MSEQQPEEQDLTPQPSRILAEPATVETCRADYKAGADVRDRLGWKDGQS